MKIAVRGGHNFLATGSSALIDETTEDRRVKDSVIKYLRELGNDVLDVTPGNMDSDSDLVYGVSRANSWGAELFISIHFNKAYNSYSGAIGTETWVYSKTDNIKLDEEVALRIVNTIAGLGFVNRGVKERKDLYELKATKMASIIVEVCFVEATEDVALYKKLGPDKIGRAIAEAISNKSLESYKKVHVGQYVNIKPFMGTFPIFKDDSSWETYNRLALLGAPLSCKILDNPRKNVYKVEDCRYGYIGYAYIEENNNYTFTNYQAYKEGEENPKEPLYKVIVDGKQVSDQCSTKWLPGIVEEQLKKGAKDIKVIQI